MKPQYLRVKNWEKFQHYKQRRPPWVKYHVELLDDYEYLHLDYVTRLLFDGLLLLAARTDNNIPNDPEHIGRQLYIESVLVGESLEKLLLAGFLVTTGRKRSASKAIARRKQDAMPETEKRREETQVLSETVKAQVEKSLRAVS